MCVDACKGRFLIQIVAFITVLLCEECTSLSNSDLFPYNSSFGDDTTVNKDDGGSGLIELTTAFPYFNKDFRTLYINNNGIISFLKRSLTTSRKSFPLQKRPR
ncbi:hypothetical protein ScPMuIL_011104 [Solemya velum]